MRGRERDRSGEVNQTLSLKGRDERKAKIKMSQKGKGICNEKRHNRKKIKKGKLRIRKT